MTNKENWITIDELFNGKQGVPDLDDEERKRDEIVELEKDGLVNTKAENGTIYCQLTGKGVAKILKGELIDLS